MISRKHLSQNIAFGLFRLLSLSVVGILFAILGFIIYKGIGVIDWEFLTGAPDRRHDIRRYPACHRRYFLPDDRQRVVCFPGGGDERHLYERICA